MDLFTNIIIFQNWTNLIQAAVNASNATIPPSSLDDLPLGMIPGDPILYEFDPFPAAGSLRGVSPTLFYSTMAEIEIQFSLLTSTDPVSIS